MRQPASRLTCRHRSSVRPASVALVSSRRPPATVAPELADRRHRQSASRHRRAARHPDDGSRHQHRARAATACWIPGEQCDDGNKMGGDGCTPSARFRTVGRARGTPSVCTHGGRLRRRHPRRDRGLRRQATRRPATAARRPASGRDGLRVPRARPHVRPAVRRRRHHGRRAVRRRQHDGRRRLLVARASSSRARPARRRRRPASKCTASVCGNGMKEGNESCDCGDRRRRSCRAGCSGPNGLFNGDGTRLLEDLHQGAELPRHRRHDAAPATRACGNGNIETGEECDDGNTQRRRRLLVDVQARGGLHVHARRCSPTRGLHAAGNSGQCLELPIMYRDFKNEQRERRPPRLLLLRRADREPGNGQRRARHGGRCSFNKRYCVPNSSGPAKKNDSTARCWDIAQANLDANGKPAFNTPATAAGGNATLRLPVHRLEPQRRQRQPRARLRRRDGGRQAAQRPHLRQLGQQDRPPGVQGPGAGRHAARPPSASGGPTAPTRATARRPASTPSASLELGPVAGATNAYRFSSAPAQRLGGFFPLDPAATSSRSTRDREPAGSGAPRTSAGRGPSRCSATCGPTGTARRAFGAGAGCKADQYVFPPSLRAHDRLGSRHLVRHEHPTAAGSPQAAGLVPRLVVLGRGALPVQLQRGVQPAVLRRRRHVHLHQRRARDRPRRRAPAASRARSTSTRTAAPRPRRAANLWPAPTRPATNCPVIPAGSRSATSSPARQARDRPVTRSQFNSTCTSGTTCDCRHRTLTAAQTGLGRPRWRQHLRDRGLRRRRPPDGVELPAHAERVLDQRVELQRPAAATASRTGAEECDCGDTAPPRPSDPPLRRHDQRRHDLRRLHDEVQVRPVLRRRHVNGDGGVRPRQRDEHVDLRRQRLHAGLQEAPLLRRRHRRRQRGRAVRPRARNNSDATGAHLQHDCKICFGCRASRLRSEQRRRAWRRGVRT